MDPEKGWGEIYTLVSFSSLFHHLPSFIFQPVHLLKQFYDCCFRLRKKIENWGESGKYLPKFLFYWIYFSLSPFPNRQKMESMTGIQEYRFVDTKAGHDDCFWNYNCKRGESLEINIASGLTENWIMPSKYCARKKLSLRQPGLSLFSIEYLP